MAELDICDGDYGINGSPDASDLHWVTVEGSPASVSVG